MKVTNCDCGSTDLAALDSGTSNTGVPWTEWECQNCGSVFFEDDKEETE